MSNTIREMDGERPNAAIYQTATNVGSAAVEIWNGWKPDESPERCAQKICEAIQK